MANLKEVRIRIASTISTQQITKAMKLVSATKLRKAQGAIVQMRPYATKLKGILSNLSDSVEDPNLSKFFRENETQKVLLVVITSDRGLCGAFNSNVTKRTKLLIDTKYKKQAEAGNVTVLPIGKKGMDFVKKLPLQLKPEFVDTFQSLDAESAFAVADNVLKMFLNGDYDVVELVYNQFKNAATQVLVNETLLPVQLEKTSEKKEATDYLFEPGKVAILEELIPRSLKTQFYRALLDSFASEHGARMVSMDKATENAGEILKQLKLQYNQARQAAITREISEIVGGAAALAG